MTLQAASPVTWFQSLQLRCRATFMSPQAAQVLSNLLNYGVLYTSKFWIKTPGCALLLWAKKEPPNFCAFACYLHMEVVLRELESSSSAIQNTRLQHWSTWLWNMNSIPEIHQSIWLTLFKGKSSGKFSDTRRPWDCGELGTMKRSTNFMLLRHCQPFYIWRHKSGVAM